MVQWEQKILKLEQNDLVRTNTKKLPKTHKPNALDEQTRCFVVGPCDRQNPYSFSLANSLFLIEIDVAFELKVYKIVVRQHLVPKTCDNKSQI